MEKIWVKENRMKRKVKKKGIYIYSKSINYFNILH